MQTLFLTTPLRRMALAFSLLLPTVSAHAALPSVEVRVDFTGSQAGGGNGAQPNGALSALDGYLYGSTVFGGGTEADLDGTNGNFGGRVPVFFRIREDGDGYEVLQRAPELLPASDYGWLAGSDGHLYAPSNTSLGLLLRYLPGSDGWTAFGPEAATSRDRGATVSELGGRFVIGSSNSSSSVPPFRSLSLDGTTVSELPATSSNSKGNRPILTLADEDGALFAYFSGGGGYGRGALVRLSPDGTELEKLVTFDDTTVGGYNSLIGRPMVLAGDYVYGVTRFGELNGGVLWRVPRDAQPEIRPTYESELDIECLQAGNPISQCITQTLIDPGSPEQVEILHSFSTANLFGGSEPDYLVKGADGHVYGITSGGIGFDGELASGAIWRYRDATSPGEEGVLEVLHTFSDARPGTPRNNLYQLDGQEMTSTINTGANAGGHTVNTLAVADNGALFGTTALGGSYGWGTLFRFHPGDEIPEGAALSPVPPQVVFGINSLNAANQHYAVAVGGRFSLYWQAVYSDGCMASSDDPDAGWSGAQPSSARYLTEAFDVDANELGTWTYTLTCQADHEDLTGPVSSTVTVDVVPVVAEPRDVGNGGGGALSPVMLLIAALAAALTARRDLSVKAGS